MLALVEHVAGRISDRTANRKLDRDLGLVPVTLVKAVTTVHSVGAAVLNQRTLRAPGTFIHAAYAAVCACSPPTMIPGSPGSRVSPVVESSRTHSCQ